MRQYLEYGYRQDDGRDRNPFTGNNDDRDVNIDGWGPGGKFDNGKYDG